MKGKKTKEEETKKWRRQQDRKSPFARRRRRLSESKGKVLGSWKPAAVLATRSMMTVRTKEAKRVRIYVKGCVRVRMRILCGARSGMAAASSVTA